MAKHDMVQHCKAEKRADIAQPVQVQHIVSRHCNAPQNSYLLLFSGALWNIWEVTFAEAFAAMRGPISIHNLALLCL